MEGPPDTRSGGPARLTPDHDDPMISIANAPTFPATSGDPLPAALPGGRQPRLWLVPLALLALIVAYRLGGEDGLFSAAALNAILPAALLVVCVLAAVGLVGRYALMVVSPLLWFFLVCAAYYGWGPLVYHFGSPASIAYLQGYYYLEEATLLRTNLLNAACIFTLCLVFFVGIRLFPLRVPQGPLVFDQDRRDRFILISLLCGAPIRYLVVPLNNRGAFGGWVPSQIINLHQLVLFAILLMVWSYARGERRWRRILLPLVAWEFLLRFSSSGKLEFFLLLLPIFLGVFLARPGVKMLVRAIVAGVVLWWVISNVAGALRHEHFAGRRMTLTERLSFALATFETEEPADWALDEAIQSWWTRLTYSGAQGFCLERYDEDLPGDTFDLWYWAFVPRLLAPSKPEMTLGVRFNVEVTGNPQSKSAPGLFAEAYWNGGWRLALGASIYTGLLFVVLTHLAIRCILKADYRWLPVLWTGIYIGLRIDDFAVAIFLGQWPIALSSSLLLFILFPRRRFTVAAVPAAGDGRRALPPPSAAVPRRALRDVPR